MHCKTIENKQISCHIFILNLKCFHLFKKNKLLTKVFSMQKNKLLHLLYDIWDDKLI